MTSNTAAHDYRVEADECLTAALGAPIATGERRDLIALAQANATLALVEQQRLANLIAWQATLADAAFRTSPFEMPEREQEKQLARLNSLGLLISEGLGL